MCTRLTIPGTRRRLTSDAPGLDWDAYLSAAGLEKQPMLHHLAARRDQRSLGPGRQRAARDLERMADFPHDQPECRVPPAGISTICGSAFTERRCRERRNSVIGGSALWPTPTRISAMLSAKFTSRNISRPRPRPQVQEMVKNLLAGVRPAGGRARDGWRRRPKRRPKPRSKRCGWASVIRRHGAIIKGSSFGADDPRRERAGGRRNGNISYQLAKLGQADRP